MFFPFTVVPLTQPQLKQTCTLLQDAKRKAKILSIKPGKLLLLGVLLCHYALASPVLWKILSWCLIFFYKPFKIIQDFTVSRAIWMVMNWTAINQDSAGVRSCQYGSVIEFVIPSGYLSMAPHDSKHRASIITEDIGNISSEKMW